MVNRGYYEIALGVTKRGKVIPTEDLGKATKHAQDNGQELFRSYFSLSEDSQSFANEKRTISGFQGSYSLDSIILDVDKGKDADETVFSKAKGLLLELRDWDLHESQIRVYYSGSGFHFEIPDIFHFGIMGVNDLVNVKHTLTKHFPVADDLYYATSLIRMSYTVNKKTGRYKTPVTHSTMLHGAINDIIKLSETLSEVPIYPEWDELADIPNHHDKIVKVAEKSAISLPQLTHFKTLEASSMVTCIQKMYTNGPKTGSRHNTIMRMVSSFRRQGVPKSAIIPMMQSWDRTLPTEEIAKYVSDVFDKGYKWGCNDPLMAKHCDTNCRFFKKKNYSVDTMNTSDMMASYRLYLEKLNHGRILNLRDLYRMKDDFKMLPGEFITVIGDTGIGKTAWVQNLAIDFKVKTLYISLEVHEALLFRRFVQIANDLSKDEVDSAFVNMNPAILESMCEKISHIKVVTVPPTLEAIEKLIFEEQPQLVVIDTLDGLDVDGKTITDVTRVIANELKRIANLTSSIIMGIHHISKSAATDEKGGRKHLNLHSGMGSSATEQKGDKLIGIEADGGNNSPLRHITALKARDEAAFVRMPFNFNWKSFRYEHITGNFTVGGTA